MLNIEALISSAPSRKLLRKIPVCVLCLSIFTYTGSVRGQGRPSDSYESSQAEKLARTFLEDKRYAETISYIRDIMETLPEGTPRFSLLLVLANAYIAIADRDGAEETLRAARLLASTNTEIKDIVKLEMRLKEIKSLPSRTESPDERIGLAQDSVQSERRMGLEILVNNSFFETDLRQVLTDLSMDAKIPIIWDNTIEGIVTYEAIDQPLEIALRAILLPLGYAFKVEGGTYFVGSPKPDDPAFCLLSVTETVTLANIEATEAIGLLSDYFRPYVKASKAGNIVCISAPPITLARIKSDLALMDEPPVQILIEVIVSEIATSALRKLGLDWWLSGTGENPEWEIRANHAGIDNSNITGDIVQLGMKFDKYTVDLAGSLEALVQSGDATIRANPRIATLNGHKAEISLTKDQYFIIATSVSQNYQYNTLQAVSSGIKLEITPYASSTGEITLVLKPEVGDVVGSGANNLPEINKRTASTSVSVRDNQTFTIGGLNLQKKKVLTRKVPLLGDIPLLGRLFRYDESEVQDTQIIIFVTPHILKG